MKHLFPAATAALLLISIASGLNAQRAAEDRSPLVTGLDERR